MWVNESFEKYKPTRTPETRSPSRDDHSALCRMPSKEFMTSCQISYCQTLTCGKQKSRRLRCPDRELNSPPMLETRLAKLFSPLIVTYLEYTTAIPAACPYALYCAMKDPPTNYSNCDKSII
jgi:hypothetical protein